MGLLDSLDDNTRLSLGLLAAAGPRADGAGFGQRLLEGINTGYAMGDAAEKRKMTQLQFQSAQRKSDLINAAIAGDQAPQQTQSPTGTPTAIGQPGNGMPGMQQQADMPMAPVSRGAAPWSQQKINAFAMTGDPGLQKAAELEQARQLSGQTDIGKLMAQAGIDSNSPLGKQITQQQLMKQNYVAPTSLRPGGYAQYADGRTEQMPHVPDGFTAIKGEDQAWHIVPVNGGINALSASTQATTLGKTMGTLGQGVDTSGAPSYFLGLPPGVSGAKPQSGIQGNFSGDPSSIAAGIASIQDPQERVNAQSAFDQQVKATLPGSQVIRPANAPGFDTSQNALAVAGAKRFTDTIALASDSPTRVNVYDNILKLSQEGVASGPGQEWKNKFKGYVANTPGLSSVAGSWKDDVSGFQELNKFMYQNAQRNWQAAGGTGTDAQLEAYSHSNPNSTMFPQALQAMAQWGKAGELALQAKTNAMQNWKDSNGGNVANQDQFERTWRNNFDPQIFQLKTMPQDQAAKFVSDMKTKNPSAYANLMIKAKTLSNIGAL